MCSINNIALFQRKIKSFLAVNSKWHCGGCLIKQARRCAARQAPATNRHNATNKTEKPPKKQRRRRKSGGAVNPLRSPDFFTPPRSLLFHYVVFSFRRCYLHRLFGCAFYTPSIPCSYTLRSLKRRFLPTVCKPLPHRNFACGVL